MSDCAFNDFFDCEFTIYEEHTQRARKEHHCCECRKLIVLGDTYHRASALCDGSWDHYKTCLDCAELRGHFHACMRGLWEEATAQLFETEALTAGGPCLEGLSAAAKAKLFEQWRAWKGLAA